MAHYMSQPQRLPICEHRTSTPYDTAIAPECLTKWLPAVSFCLLAACSKSDPLIGTWVSPVETVNLLADGTAVIESSKGSNVSGSWDRLENGRVRLTFQGAFGERNSLLGHYDEKEDVWNLSINESDVRYFRRTNKVAKRLIGTWRLVSLEVTTDTGDAIYPRSDTTLEQIHADGTVSSPSHGPYQRNNLLCHPSAESAVWTYGMLLFWRSEKWGNECPSLLIRPSLDVYRMKFSGNRLTLSLVISSVSQQPFTLHYERVR
jgi:hypothetical protein